MLYLFETRVDIVSGRGYYVVFDKGDGSYFCKMMFWTEDYGVKHGDFCLSKIKNKWLVDNAHDGPLGICISKQINAWNGYSEKMRAEARKTFKYMDIAP